MRDSRVRWAVWTDLQRMRQMQKKRQQSNLSTNVMEGSKITEGRLYLSTVNTAVE